MRIKYVIYSHISRKEYAEKLLSKLPKGSEIYEDNGSGHLEVVKKCLTKYKNQDIDYLVLLEDDIELCEHFNESVINALSANVLRKIITLFSMSKQVEQAFLSGHHWIKSNSISWLQAVVYPKEKIDDILKYYNPNFKYFDTVISTYLQCENDILLQTVPNLVQHLELKSTIGNPTRIGGKPRTSKCFRSGKDIDFKRKYYAPVQSNTQKKIINK